MANQNYAHANAAFMQAQINLLTGNVKIAALSPDYPGGAVAIANDQWFTSVAAYVLAGSNPVRTLTGKTVAVGPNYGVFDADDTALLGMAAGHTLGYMVYFIDPDGANIDGMPASGNYGSARLIHLADEGSNIGTGTNGGDIDVLVNAAGIFRL